MTTFLWWKRSLTEVQVLLSALRNLKTLVLFKELWTVGVGGGRATPYNDLCGKGVPFQVSGICERVGVSLFNGYEREGAVISVCEKDLKGPVDGFYGCKRDKKPFWFNTFKKKKKYALYLSVNVFSTKVLIVDTNFTSPNGDGAAILRGHPSHAKV